MPENVNSFSKVVKIMSYVFETVPWTFSPYTGKDHKLQLKNSGAIQYLKEGFEGRRIGGWCGLNCEFFKRIMIEHGFSVASFNYGIVGILTHIVLIVKINECPYLFDPYFNRYYEVDGKNISFEELMNMVNNNDTSKVKSVYGIEKKPVERRGGLWVDMTGQELEESVVSSAINNGLNTSLIEKFGSDNLFNLMRINIPI